MQTELEVKAIKKRTVDIKQNGEKLFGVSGNQVKGSDITNEYDIEGSKNRKGGENQGSIVDHLHPIDLSSGGNIEDQKSREKQLSYTISGINKYDDKNTYSDADAGNVGDVSYSKIDTSENIGQIIIY